MEMVITELLVNNTAMADYENQVLIDSIYMFYEAGDGDFSLDFSSHLLSPPSHFKFDYGKVSEFEYSPTVILLRIRFFYDDMVA